jgi:hypothetical protein
MNGCSSHSKLVKGNLQTKEGADMPLSDVVEFGNANAFSPQGGGWLVGFGENFKNPTLRRMAKNALAHTIGLKWMVHNAGDSGGTNKPVSDGCTISILISQGGDFCLEFSTSKEFTEKAEDKYVQYHLTKFGDFVVWGGRIHHQWSVPVTSTILTVRWVPIEHWNHHD